VDELLALPPAEERRRRAAAPPRPAAIAPERVADGVFRLPGEYDSLLVEFKDHLVVLEAPQGDARALAVMAEARRLFPSKRIRFVVNTHAHFDHAEGLPAFVAEGITVITDDTSRYFLEAAFSEPRTLLTDTLAKTRRKPKIEGVLDRRVLTDGTRTIELRHLENFSHSDGMLIAWLSQERILFTADAATRAAAVEQFGLRPDRHIEVRR
jgi:glyoxylase-like metal-dependent hydrolase (beta-lactamase superfamily II)